ncbi:thioredoxin family protein [Oceanicaulis sp. LC35]|uniref:thioredoxin family protein n=1 Tax=Oceanicaulis sp. LC35 TaxID=3349635 RepID=UPI003F837FC6
MIRLILNASAALVLGLTGAAMAQEAPLYPENADASAVIDAALAQARDEGKQALIVFGGDWCHDSVALAEALDENDRLASLVSDHYVLARVDVGHRHRNQDQLHRFGLEGTFGTPTLVIASGEGAALNGATAHDWRTAYNAAPSDIAAYLSHYGGADWDGSPVASVDLDAVAESWSPYQTAMQTLASQRETGEISAEDAASLQAFVTGMARSIARYGAGQEAEAQSLAVADRADLNALGVTPSGDLTDAVIVRVAEVEFDLLARFEAQTEETRAALAGEPDAE